MSLVHVVRGSSRASGLLMVLLLVSCGGGGDGGDTASPTLAPTRTPTASLTSSELPSPTSSPDVTNGTGLPSPTSSPDETESAGLPSPTSSVDQSETAEPGAETSVEEPATPTPDPTAPAADGAATPADEPVSASAEDDGVPPSVWWLMAVLVVGAAVAIPLVMRARRRSTWQQNLRDAEEELAWFARELLPGLRQAGSQEMVAGGWAVGQERVSAAEDRLTVLESTASDEVGRERARSLRDAVRQARVRMELLTAPGASTMWVLHLDELIADFEVALGPLRPSRPSPVSSSE